MRRIALLILISGACLFAFQDSSTKSVVPIRVPRKVALVVGNSAYQHIPAIEPAIADANDMAATLRRLGFDEVEVKTNLTAEALVQTVIHFSRSVVRGGDLALIYYSGHGGQAGEENYLLPIDYEPPSEDELVERRGGYRMSKVRDALEKQGARVRVLIFDACRSSPVVSTKDSVSSNLRPMEGKPEGTFIAYASAHNQASRFERGQRNSFYTAELLEALKTPSLDLKAVFEQAQFKVYERTKGVQRPYVYGFLSGRVYLGPTPSNPAPTRNDGTLSAEAEAWNAVKDSGDIQLLEQFVARFPQSDYVFSAQAKMATLRRTVAAVPVAVNRGPQPGDVKVNPKDGQRYVWIPPGRFQMGCSAGDSECFGDEKPAHEVTISKGYWMGQTAVTVGAWKKVGLTMPPEPKFFDRALNEGWKDEQQPIVNVTWPEAKQYCEATGMRLPTEAEWEYAARAGSGAARYGNLNEIAWYADNCGKEKLDSAEIWKNDQKNYGNRLNANGNGPHGVGLKSPNSWKLYDMLGNVWQWTADWYGEKYYEQQEGRDPIGPPGGTQRVLRGGSWVSDPANLRVSLRVRIVPGDRDDSVGLRCVGE